MGLQGLRPAIHPCPLQIRYEKRGGVGGAVHFRPDTKSGEGGGGGVLPTSGPIQQAGGGGLSAIRKAGRGGGGGGGAV